MDWNNCPLLVSGESIGLGYEDDAGGQSPMPPVPMHHSEPNVEPAPMPPSILPMPQAAAEFHSPLPTALSHQPPIPHEFVRLPTLPYRWDLDPPVHVALEE